MDKAPHPAPSGLDCAAAMPPAAIPFTTDLQPDTFPKPLAELCAHLEDGGIGAWLQGDGLLHEMQSKRGSQQEPANDSAFPGALGALGRLRTLSLLCTGSGEAILRALPRAVVTTAQQARITQATTWGPVDLIPLGDAAIEEKLPAFGLSAFAFAFQPAGMRWAQVNESLERTVAGELDLALAGGIGAPNPFAEAPRRYWIAARLIAEYGLTPNASLMTAAQEAFPDIVDALPLGASARRMVERVLASPSPGRALRFLRESGVTPALFPGASVDNETRIEHLAPLPAIRWAAWLRGSATQRGLVRLRTPHALARRVERVQEAHPLDRSVASLREASIRRVLGRLEAEELDALFAWRRLELEERARVEPDGPTAQAERRKIEERLAGIENRIAETREAKERSGIVRALALDGAAVMQILDIGPGRQIGQALAHLARFIAMHPEKNERDALESELRAFAARNP